MEVVKIKTCLTCGSMKIRRVKSDIESRRGGKPFVAKGIEIEECPVCGERLFSTDSLEQIATQQPAPRVVPRRRKSA